MLKVATVVPKLKIGDMDYNTQEIIKFINKGIQDKVRLLVFPELNLTGYTLGDLFNQQLINQQLEKCLLGILNSKNYPNIYGYHKPLYVVIGAPIRKDNQLFNCAIVLSIELDNSKNKVLCVVPKTYIPNYNEFYEKRWFSSSKTKLNDTITLLGEEVLFSENIILKDEENAINIGIEICEDLWAPIPPSTYHCLYGANVIVNLSASNEVVGKKEHRRKIVEMQSVKNMCAYLYCSAGMTESTTDLVFSGHNMIVENGKVLKEGIFKDDIMYTSEIDIDRLNNDRIKFNTFMYDVPVKNYHYLPIELSTSSIQDRKVNNTPFVPKNDKLRFDRCKDIINIQSEGLVQRLNSIPHKKVILGISGGLDSTLALLVCVDAMKKLNLPLDNIIGVTMPGFGTSKRTFNNSIGLMERLKITSRTIDIKEVCLKHFEDIGHDKNVADVTYENVQARERTQILMDIANKENAIVIGTGDLSELALGWCTYNGDHMSMYAVNSSIPKTLIRYLVETYAYMQEDTLLRDIILDVCGTPISPELLPVNEKQEMVQKTENSIGSYLLHDFFLYYMIRFGYSPTYIYELACIAFKNEFSNEEILKTLKTFYRRFFSQQFKRSCLPDGPKVGTICLSPRGDWRMPSDTTSSMWLNELEKIK